MSGEKSIEERLETLEKASEEHSVANKLTAEVQFLMLNRMSSIYKMLLQSIATVNVMTVFSKTMNITETEARDVALKRSLDFVAETREVCETMQEDELVQNGESLREAMNRHFDAVELTAERLNKSYHRAMQGIDFEDGYFNMRSPFEDKLYSDAIEQMKKRKGTDGLGGSLFRR